MPTQQFPLLLRLFLNFRFHEHWRFVLQRLVFLSAFVVYLEGENLVTREEVAQILGSRYHSVYYVYPELGQCATHYRLHDVLWNIFASAGFQSSFKTTYRVRVCRA